MSGSNLVFATNGAVPAGFFEQGFAVIGGSKQDGSELAKLGRGHFGAGTGEVGQDGERLWLIADGVLDLECFEGHG